MINIINNTLSIDLTRTIYAGRVGGSVFVRYSYSCPHGTQSNIESHIQYTTSTVSPSLEGQFRMTSGLGKIFIYFEGGWKHILNWETYSACFDLNWTSMNTPGYGVDPNPVTGVFNGYLGMQGTTGDVYLITPMPVPMLPIGRHIANPAVFDTYHFDWHKIKRNLGSSFSPTGPVINAP